MNNTYSAGYYNVDLQIGKVKSLLHVFYPCDAPETLEKIGPFSLELALNPMPSIGQFPLILFSHGSGSMPLLFRTLGQYLARKGFIVGLLEHSFNNRNDNSAADTIENLINRPLQLHATIDWFFEKSSLKSNLIYGNVSIIGHSMGGYTALALAGGIPTPMPHELANARPITTVKDKRIRSIVLLAPATVWFREKDALSQINVPILMYTAELDRLTPKMPHADIVLEGVKGLDILIHKEIKNAGHFSFMSPYPAELKNESIPPSQDPIGFDREAFLSEMNPEIAEFLLRYSQ
jgi:predicted dienelactone hydrolase